MSYLTSVYVKQDGEGAHVTLTVLRVTGVKTAPTSVSVKTGHSVTPSLDNVLVQQV